MPLDLEPVLDLEPIESESESPDDGLPADMSAHERKQLDLRSEMAAAQKEGEQLSATESRIPDLRFLTEVPGGAENFLKIIHQQREFDRAIHGGALMGAVGLDETTTPLEKGINQAKDEFLAGQATPLGMGTAIATLGFGGASPVLQAAGKTAAGIFAVEGAKGAYEQGQRFKEATEPEEQIAALAGMGVSGATAVGGAMGVLHRAPKMPPDVRAFVDESIARGENVGLTKSTAAALKAAEKAPIEAEAKVEPLREAEKGGETLAQEEKTQADVRQQGVAEVEPLADRVAAMTAEEVAAYAKETRAGGSSPTAESYKLGRETTTPEQLAKLKAHEAAAKAEFDAAREAENVEVLSPLAAKKQFFTEAIEEAVGAAQYKGKDVQKFNERMAAGEVQPKGLPADQVGTPPEVATAKPAESVSAGALGELGMGAAKLGEQDPRTSLGKLTDSIKTLAEEGQTAPSKAFSLGESLSEAKDRVSNAIDGLKAVGSYLKVKLEGKPVVTDYKNVLGDRHLALSESSVNARKWVKNVEKALPLKVREAISNWMDTGGDAVKLSQAASETKPAYKAGYELAQNLTPDQQVVAQNLRNYFDSRLQEAIDAGILEDGIENYIHRTYEQESPWKTGVIAELRSGIFTGKPALAKKRVFEYDFEAEKAGKKPIKDFAKRVVAYDLALNKAIADRAAVKAMMEIRMPDGRPMIDVGGGGKVIQKEGVTEATLINRSAKKIDPENPKADRSDFKPYDHPALRKWKWVAQDAEGKPIFVQGDVLIHPQAVKDIHVLLGKSAVRQNPIGRVALGVSSTIKQTMLDLSGFHPVQIAIHGTEHRTFAPVKEIDFTNPDVRGLVRGGLVVGETTGLHAFSEGLSGGSLTKHIPWAGERLQAYNSWLFEDYIPRLKVAMGTHAMERNRARFPKLSEDELYQLTANQANAAFGEQNYTMLGRSKTTQDALRLVLLAPDFLEARSRFVAQAFTQFGAEQRQALLLGAATMYITARLINKMLTDEYHFEPKNAFNVVYGGKSYGLRTVQGDLIHAATDTGKFVNHRLNPIYGKPALEFITGRDYFGRKRTAAEQAKDLATTPIPISLKGATEGQEQKLFESFLNAFGFVTKRDSPSSDMAVLAEKWKKENKVSTGPGEFIYDAEKDPFRPIKLAAERGDKAGVRSEIAKAVNDGMTKSQIHRHFVMSERHRFTGSAANEQTFLESLTEDQRKLYNDAKEERQRIRQLVGKLL